MEQERNLRPDATDTIDLAAVWEFLVRNRTWVVGSLVGTVVASLAYVWLATPTYEATTSIRIEEAAPGLQLAAMLDPTASGDEVATEMEVLRSRSIAEAVIDSLGLRLRLESPGAVPRSGVFRAVRVRPTAEPGEYRLIRNARDRFSLEDRASGEALGGVAPGGTIRFRGIVIELAPAAAEHARIDFDILPYRETVEDVRETLAVDRPNRDAHIVTVTYRAPDPYLVQAVPNAVARSFIDRRHTVRKTEAHSTVLFLRGQIDTLTAQLTAAEEALRAFREGARVISLEAQASSQVRQLAELQATRNATDAERSALARFLAQVRRSDPVDSPLEPSPLRRLIVFPTLFRNEAASSLLGTLAAVENQRAELLNRRMPRDPDVQVLTDRIRAIEAQLESIAETYLQGLANQVAALDATLTRFGNQLERIPATEVEYLRLRRRAALLEEIQTLLQTRLKEAEITRAVEDASVRIVDPAITPSRPIRPRKVLTVVLALGLGLVLGVGAAFTRERMDTTVKTREDVRAATAAPVIGLIPRFAVHSAAARRGGFRMPWEPATHAPDSGDARRRWIATTDPYSPITEAYRSLRTNITYADPTEPPKVIAVTSPTPGDGKTTTAANLATTLAQQGMRTILLDADLRRGLLHETFHRARQPGLSEVLLGRTPVEDAAQLVEFGTDHSLRFVPTGILPPNPAKLLGSKRMATLIDRLRRDYDAVILDSPPLAIVTDAAVLGRETDGILVVARAGVTDHRALAHVAEQLRTVGVRLLGIVLNDVDLERDRRYYGSYRYADYAPHGADSDTLAA